MKKIAVIVLLIMVSATSFAANVNGELRIKLENSDSNTTLQYDKTVLSISGKLKDNKVKVAVDLKAANIAVPEAYIEMGPLVVGKYKMPFGIGNYGLNTPLAVRSWNGNSAMGIWLIASVPLQYKLGLLNGQRQEPGKNQLGWLKYGLGEHVSLYGSLLNKEDGKAIYSAGALYKLDQLELSGEYVAGQSIGSLSGIIIQGKYLISPELNLYTSYSQLDKTLNHNTTKFAEIILGGKYTLTQGLDWETEYIVDPDENQNNSFISRLKVKL